MNDFDQAARYIVKADATGHVRWLFPKLQTHLAFARWLDSQSAPRPGEPDRRCDTIAELVDTTGASGPRALVMELFTDADANACSRTLQYLGRFATEIRHGPHGRDVYNFSAGMIFLTNRPGVVEIVSNLPADEATLVFRPRLRVLSEEVAIATLDAFEENRLGWGVLAWVSLMQGGQTPALVARWRAIVEKLADTGMRRTLLDVIVVFAQLTDSVEVWKKGLEGMDMNESIVMREVREKGRAEGREEATRQARRDAVLEALGTRFTVPVEVRERILSESDIAVLIRWLPLAVTADLDSFKAAIGLG